MLPCRATAAAAFRLLPATAGTDDAWRCIDSYEGSQARHRQETRREQDRYRLDQGAGRAPHKAHPPPQRASAGPPEGPLLAPGPSEACRAAPSLLDVSPEAGSRGLPCPDQGARAE